MDAAFCLRAIQYFPDARYTLIEPQADLQRHVQDLVDHGYRIEWLAIGAGNEPGMLDFTISPRADSSSFLPTRQEAAFSGRSQIRVEVSTLNELVRSRHLPIPEMVKIDAEGFDLKVLAGASDLLGKTEIFLVEAAVVARNLENTAAAVMDAMTTSGYRLVDITDLNRSPKHDALWLCEFAFINNTNSLLDGIQSYD